MLSQEKSELLVSVSELYFFNGKNQQEIANLIGVSRPSVSRLLAEARELGVVQIKIRDPNDSSREMEKLITKEYGLNSCRISPDLPSSDAVLSSVGRLGAEVLMDMLRPGLAIGITWGSTVKKVVEAVHNPHIPGIRVFQMVGSLGDGPPDVDGHEIARQLADKFEGSYRIVSAPSVVASKDDREALTELKIIKTTLEEASQANVCVFGVGSLEDDHSSLLRGGYLSDDDRLTYLAHGGVGHVIGRIIDHDGQEINEYNDRVIGVPLDTLRRAQRSICVATGATKVEAVRAVLQGKLATDLVIDAKLATQLSQLAPKHNKNSSQAPAIPL